MTAPRQEPGRAERLVDVLVDGLERGITKIPAPVLGIAIGLFLGWVVNILATVGPVETMSPLEAEAMNYNGGRSLLPGPVPVDQQAAAAASAPSTAAAHG